MLPQLVRCAAGTETSKRLKSCKKHKGRTVKRGCKAEFHVSGTVGEAIVRVTYTHCGHLDAAGLPCHGSGCQDAVGIKHRIPDAVRAFVLFCAKRHMAPQAIIAGAVCLHCAVGTGDCNWWRA
jgi:hypothetical protein